MDSASPADSLPIAATTAAGRIKVIHINHFQHTPVIGVILITDRRTPQMVKDFVQFAERI